MKLPLHCLAVLMCIPLAAQATVYRCTLPDGTATFQDTPCASSSAETVVNVPSVQTVSNANTDIVIIDPSTGAGYGNNPNQYFNQQPPVVVRRQVVVVRKVPVVQPPPAAPKHVERATPTSASRTTTQSHTTTR